MSTIDDDALFKTLNAGLQTTQKSTDDKTKELGQDQFFELMVAQLKNQDPINPLDGQDYLGQLAQFGTVSGIQQLQTSFDQLSQSLQSLHALQASSMVGRSVTLESSQGYLTETEALQGTVNVDTTVRDLTLIVNDLNGQEIRRINIGHHNPGPVAFSWDGLNAHGVEANPGLYQIRVEGNVNGTNQSFISHIKAQVQSVSLEPSGSGITLNLLGLGEHRLDEIIAIL